jgi:GTPase SAR1 family protein
MAPMYYRRANAAVIVYDISNEKSFIDATHWVSELQSKVDTPLAMSVVGNKTDLSPDHRVVPTDKGVEFAHSLGAMFTETSAADNTGVKEAFLKVAQGVIDLYHNHLLDSTTISSTYPISSTLSSPPPVNGGTNDVFVYNTASIGNSSKVVPDSGEKEEEKKSSICC